MSKIKISQKVSVILIFILIILSVFKTSTSVSAEDSVIIAAWNYTEAPTDYPVKATSGFYGAKAFLEDFKISYKTPSYHNDGLSLRGWDKGSGAKFWQVSFSTKSYRNIALSAKVSSSPPGPRDFKIIYSIDEGVTWNDVLASSYQIADYIKIGQDVVYKHNINLSLPVEVNNRDKLLLRFIMRTNFPAQTYYENSYGEVDSEGTSQINNIIVSGTPMVAGVSLNINEETINKEETLKLTALIEPENAGNKQVEWTASDSLVAKVEDGIITGVGPGTAIITAKTLEGGFQASCKITVEVPVIRVVIDKLQANIRLGETLKLNAMIDPLDATNKNVNWRTSDPSIAEINDGVVTGVGPGTADITAITIDGEFKATCNVTVEVPVTGITFERISEILTLGSKYHLNPQIEPVNATNKNIVWQSDNPLEAEVDANGNITAVSPGSAIITATTADGNFKAECNVTVKIPVTEISLDKSAAKLKINDKLQLIAVIKPDSATNKFILWTSSNSEVASVDESGVVTANSAGIAEITAESKDSGIFAKSMITVVAPVEGIKLDRYEDKITINDIVILTATIEPGIATNKNVSWVSSDTDVATVDNGVVTAKGGGTAVITATTEDGGYKAECSITVNVPVIGIGLNKRELELKTGEIYSLIYEVMPVNATNKSVQWTSSNPQIASVDNSGNVTAVDDGKAIITLRTDDGGFESSCIVNVTVPVVGVSLDTIEKVIKVGGPQFILNAIFDPVNATNKSIVWETSDCSVATVNDGIVTAVGSGKVTIIAKTVDGGFEKSCNVTVEVPVTGMTLDCTNKTLTIGSKFQINPKVDPVNATNKDILWESSNKQIADVDGEGNITALSAGTVEITTKTVDGGFKDKCIITVIVPVTDVNLEKTGVTIRLGDDPIKLNAAVYPEYATNKSIQWTSSNSQVVTVENGVVTAKDGGTADITVETVDGGFKDSCTITVIIPATGIQIEDKYVTMKPSENIQLNTVILPENATNKNVIWSSSDESIATIKDGVVTAIGPGSVTIKVMTVDGSFTATADAQIVQPVMGVILDMPTQNLKVGQTDTLFAMVFPENATNKNVVWSSSDESIVTVKDGVVTAVGLGKVTITVTTMDGNFSASVLGETIQPVSGVTLDTEKFDIRLGNSQTLKATVYPQNASNKNVVWESSDEKVATVVDGVVTGLSKGTATITVTTVDGGYSAKAVVSISAAAIGIELNKSNLKMEVGKSEKLVAQFVPGNLYSRDFIWSSSDGSVAIVENGIVTAIKEGIVTITVKTKDGKYQASVTIVIAGKVA